MPGAQKAEHVTLQVEDTDQALEFYRETFGLGEVARSDGTTYLGCGLDANYDVAITEGPAGIDHLAVRAEDAAHIDRVESRLDDRGVDFRRTDGAEPGQALGLRFRLPSEMAFELVTVEDTEYRHMNDPAIEGRGGIAPVDLNHVAFLSPMVKTDAEFLRDVVGMRISETVKEDWTGGAFLRQGDMHHDVAIFDMPGTPEDHATHHHTAFTLKGVDHMVSLIDVVTQAGSSLELGIGRHYAGDNLYSYFIAPDGHRIELNVQMGELDQNTPRNFVEDLETAVSAWKPDLELPESFAFGSGLVR